MNGSGSPRTWLVPPGREREWESLPLRALAFGLAERRVTLSFPEARQSDLERLAHDLVLAAPPAEAARDLVRRVCHRFLDRRGAGRRDALDLLAAVTDRAPAMLEESFDHLFRAWSEPPDVEGLLPAGGRARRLVAPRLVYHVLAGNVPWAGVESLFAATLAGSASLIKLSSKEPVLAGLVAQALAAEDAGWASALAVLHWPGGDHALEEAVLAEADCVVAYGDNLSVAAYATRLAHRIASGRVVFVPRGHRTSVALLGPGVLAGEEVAVAAARALAFDVACEDQEGCLSPTAIYLVQESAAAITPEGFGELVAHEMQRREAEWPRCRLGSVEAAAVQQARAEAEFEGKRLWTASESTAWTVILDPSAGFEPAPPARVARVCVVNDLEAAVAALVAARGLISTVGIAGWEDAEEVLAALAPVAPGRVCPLGTMQRPPAGWNHEGASDLAALVRWMEWEGEKR
jgi:Acyl-CoA reductase (LuxC)